MFKYSTKLDSAYLHTYFRWSTYSNIHTPEANAKVEGVKNGSVRNAAGSTNASSAQANDVSKTRGLHRARKEEAADFVQLSSPNLVDTRRILDEKINGKLRAELESIARAQGREVSDLLGEDSSPKATAGRILSFALGFYLKYQEQHPELSEEEAREAFADIIEGAIGKGFREALEFLDGVGALEGNVREQIDETRRLIDQGLRDFRQTGKRPDMDS